MTEQCALAGRKCVPCEGGTPPLDKPQAEALAQNVPQWQLDDEVGKITRKLKLKNFTEAMKLVNIIAELAESEGHHPDILIQWNRVTLTLTTHAAKGLTENDFIMATKIDQLPGDNPMITTENANDSEGNILIVEDDPDDSKAMSMVLKSSGYQTTCVSDTTSAREILSDENLDLILLDLRLNGSSGLSLLNSPEVQTSNIPVLVLTASPDSEAHLLALELGAADVLRKPADLPALRAKLQVHIKLKRLSDKLAQQNHKLADTQKRLEQTLMLKRQFLSLIAHDLRAPITTIKLTAEVFSEHMKSVEQELDHRAVDVLRVLLRSVSRVETSFEEISSIAKLDLDEISPEMTTFPLGETIDDAIKTCLPVFLGDSVSIDVQMADIANIRADQKLIHQMLIHLINNSLSRIDLRDHASVIVRDNDSDVSITVHDTGPYLEPTLITEMLTGLEERAPTANTRVSLFAASCIAKAHKGRFLVNSDLDKGTDFTVTLPK